MATKKTAPQNAPIDILEDALATGDLPPQTITLKGVDIDIRRTWTGAQVNEYMRIARAADDAEDFDAWASELLSVLSISAKTQITKFVDLLGGLSTFEAGQVIKRMGFIAGLRDEAGNFISGKPRG